MGTVETGVKSLVNESVSLPGLLAQRLNSPFENVAIPPRPW